MAKRWYVVHAYSGFEHQVAKALRDRVVRNGMEDIELRLREAGWAQSRVRLDRASEGGAVTLNLRIVPGPQVEFAFVGAAPPRKVQDELRQQWHRGVFDAQRLRAARPGPHRCALIAQAATGRARTAVAQRLDVDLGVECA